MPRQYHGWTYTKANADLDAIIAAIGGAGTGASFLPGGGRTVGTFAQYVANNTVYNVLDWGAKTDLTGDLSAVLATIIPTLPVRGAHVRVPAGQYKALSPISPTGRSVTLDGSRVHLAFDAGAVVYSYDATPGRALFNLNSLFGQDSQLLVSGGIFDGTHATATTSCFNVHTDNWTLADFTVRNFRGDGIKMTFDLAAPPIRGEIRHGVILACGRGIVADNASPSGLTIYATSVEACDNEGLYFDNAGQLTMIEVVAENNGRVNTAKENLVVLGATSATLIGCYFEDDVNQAHTSIRVDASSNIMPVFMMRGGHVTGYQVVGATGIDIGAVGVCRGVSIEGVFFVGHLTGVKLGTFVQGYSIAKNNWSDNYDPVTGSSQRIVNNSTGNGFIDKLDRFDFGTDGHEIHGRLSTTGDATFGQAVTVGKTTSDQAIGGYYRPHKVKGRVSGGASVRSDIESTISNSAMLNVVAGTLPVASTVALAGLGAGNVDNGAHVWKVTFVDASGESTGGTQSATLTVVDKATNGQVALTAIGLGNSQTTQRKVYRTKVGNTAAFFLVGTIADNVTTTFTDNIADAGLGVAMPTASTTIDLGLIIKKLARGVASIGTMDDQDTQLLANGVEQARWGTTGFFNSRLGFNVAGTQVLSTRKTAVADVASANATDLPTAITLVNELKTQVNLAFNRLRSTTGHGLWT